MNNQEDKKDLCCQEQDCVGMESCDCQGVCVCQPLDIDFDEIESDCDDCCCGDDSDDDDDDDDDDECDDDDLECTQD